MGLDMYLERRKSLTNFGTDAEKEAQVIAVDDLNKVSRVSREKYPTLEYEIAYWRKANQIHKWFVDNVQDGVDNCGRYYVGLERLKELHALCNTLLKDYGKSKRKGIALAKELLPTQSGFFFGSTDYDEYYWDDLKSTVEQLEELFKSHETGCSYVYHSSW